MTGHPTGLTCQGKVTEMGATKQDRVAPLVTDPVRKTLAAWQPYCDGIMSNSWILRKISHNFKLFCCNLDVEKIRDIFFKYDVFNLPCNFC